MPLQPRQVHGHAGRRSTRTTFPPPQAWTPATCVGCGEDPFGEEEADGQFARRGPACAW